MGSLHPVHEPGERTGTSSSFDDIDFLEDVPLRSDQGRQLSDTSHTPRGAWREHGSGGQPSATPARGTDLELAPSDSQFLEFAVHQQGSLSTNPTEVVKPAKSRGVSTSGLSFNLIARAGSGAAAAAPVSPRAASGGGGLLMLSQPGQGVPLSTAASGAAGDDLEGGAAGAASAAHGRFPPRLAHLITSPVQVPMGSVLFSIASAILVLTFFLLFIAHRQERWEATGCTLLLTAASAAAAASPASLTLAGVRDPATLVCLGKEERGPVVVEDSLAALLAAQPAAFAKAQAQLSFTPAAPGAGSSRWAVCLEVEGLQYDAAAAAATIQVGDWEAAAVADASTIYLGPEAFEAQYATGAALGQPLLVLKLDREQAEGLAAAWGRASRGGDD